MQGKSFYDFYSEIEQYISQGRFYEASQRFDSVRDAFLRDVEFNLWYSYVLVRSGRYEECIDLCKQLIAYGVSHEKLYEILVESLIRSGKDEEAVFYAKQSFEKGFTSGYLHLGLINGLINLGLLREAREACRRTEKLFPHLQKFVGISVVAIELLDGRDDAAYEILLNLLHQYPNHPDLYFFAAELYLNLGDWSEAKYYASLALSFPNAKEKLAEVADTLSARKLLGIALYLVERWEEAEHIFRQLIAENVPNDFLVFMLCDTLRSQGKLSEARDIVESYLQASHDGKDCVNLLLLYSWIVYLLGDLELAKTILRRALQQNPAATVHLVRGLPIETLLTDIGGR